MSRQIFHVREWMAEYSQYNRIHGISYMHLHSPLGYQQNFKGWFCLLIAKLLTHDLLFIFFRSLCEDSSTPEWKAAEKEEDYSEKEYAQSLLQ